MKVGFVVLAVSADELSELTHSHSLIPVVDARPGSTLDIDLGKAECCYSFEAIPACAVYSVTPPSAATIDPETGVLTIDPATPSGTTVHVVADVQDGAKLVELDVRARRREHVEAAERVAGDQGRDVRGLRPRAEASRHLGGLTACAMV